MAQAKKVNYTYLRLNAKEADLLQQLLDYRLREPSQSPQQRKNSIGYQEILNALDNPTA